MENYDDRRRRQSNDDRNRSRSGYEDEGGGEARQNEGSHESHPPRRAERGWLDYEPDVDRADERPRRGEDPRYGQRGRAENRDYGQRAQFSPDWSREGEEPRHSDDPYYSRNREHEREGGNFEDYSRRGLSGGRQDRGAWEQRARQSIPREQHELAQRGEPGDYYDPNWPYERRERGRDVERSRDDELERHYRGVYRHSATPFSYPGGSGYLYAESWTLHGPYTGRGPKGYRRSDQQITEEACQRLERDGEIDASDIEVSADNGVIRLRGTVQDRRTKRRAEECVESIYGVNDVMNELRVSRQGMESGAERGQSAQGTPVSQTAPRAQTAQGSPVGRTPQAPGAQASPSQGMPGPQAPPGSQSTTQGSPAMSQGTRQGPGSQGGEDDRKSPRH